MRAATAAVVPPLPKIRIPEKYRRLYENLMRLRERLTKQIDFLTADNLTRSQQDTEVDFRSKEQGTDNFDRDFALNCVSRDQDAIFEIDEALNRIQLGTYGKCESCGHSIEAARLASLPYSRLCIACKSKLETDPRAKRTAESGSLYHIIEKSAAEPGGGDEE
jgi:RNA polymerase-binding transcription factor DksA